MEKFWQGFVKKANLFDQMRKAPKALSWVERIKAAPSARNISGAGSKVGVMPKAAPGAINQNWKNTLGRKAPSVGGSASQGAAASQAIKPSPEVSTGIPTTKWKDALKG